MLSALIKGPLVRHLGPLAGWSLFVWVTRMRNIWADAGLSESGQLWRFAVAATFTAGGLATLALIVRGRQHGLRGQEPAAVAVFAVFTIVYWVARDAQILGADHSAGFKAVHLVLGGVAVAVAVRALRYVIQGAKPALATS